MKQKATNLKSLIESIVKTEVKKQLIEASNVDLSYIVKGLKDYKKGIISFDKLVEGISIDLNIRNDKKKVENLEYHLSIIIDEIKPNEYVSTAKEIINMKF
jgi:O-phosphoseryl-tRNA(Cys) synthetase